MSATDDFRDHLGMSPVDKPFDGNVDLSGVPTEMCLCGSDTFKILVKFYEGEIVWYTSTMYCAKCGAKATAPMPE